MFTGIVKEIGIVKRFDRTGSVHSLEIETKMFNKTGIGDSIAVNGVCLTVTSKYADALSFDVMEETLQRSTLKDAKRGEEVNLEDALSPDGKLGGHFVLGHIDYVGKISDVTENNNLFSMEVEMPEKFRNLVVEKGSVALDGVSLTVGKIGKGSFRVYLIPHTSKTTTLGSKRKGDGLNVELDIIGKYAARASGGDRPATQLSRITEDFLRQKGF